MHSNSQQDANSYKKFEQTHLDIQKDVDDCLLVLVVLDEIFPFIVTPSQLVHDSTSPA